MNPIKTLLISLLLTLQSITLLGIEAIEHNNSNIFFIDSCTIFKFNINGDKLIGKHFMPDDTAYQGSFLRNYAKGETINSQIALRRLKIAQYENLILNHHKILIAVRFLSLDTSRAGFEIMLVEFDGDLQFKRIYFLHECKSPQYGTVDIYSRFKMHMNGKNEVLFSLLYPPMEKLNTDSQYYFASFKLDTNNNALKFSNLLGTKKDALQMKVHVFNYFPFDKYYFPIQIPINFASQPAYFLFPYLVIRNFNGVDRIDPFNHTAYNKAHGQINTANPREYHAHGLLYNTLTTPQLVLGYTQIADTLIFIVTNYSDTNPGPFLVRIHAGKHIATPLTQSSDKTRTWYHFIDSKIIAVRYADNKYSITYIY